MGGGFFDNSSNLDAHNFVANYRLSVFASEQIPITVTKTGDADEVYERLLGSDLFVVPNAGDERLAEWPALQSKDLKVTGKGMKEAAADIVLSSAGTFSLGFVSIEN